MSIIIIGDVHGSVHWKDFVRKRQEGDIIVFLGDYFDRRKNVTTRFASSELENFIEITDFARSVQNVHLLVGNHDYHYTPYDPVGCSNKNEMMGEEYGEAIMRNLDLLEMVFVYDRPRKPLLMSHAGVTSTFMRKNGLKKPEELNELWKNHPDRFNFQMYVNGEMAELHGDNEWQSPIWVRNNALARDALPGYDQIVGHTPYPSITEFETGNGDSVTVVCTLDQNNFIEFLS